MGSTASLESVPRAARHCGAALGASGVAVARARLVLEQLAATMEHHAQEHDSAAGATCEPLPACLDSTDRASRRSRAIARALRPATSGGVTRYLSPRSHASAARSFLASAALLAGLFVTTPADADPACEAYVRDVLDRHPSVQAAALRRDAFVHESKASGIWPDPALTVMGDYLPGTAEGAQMPMVRIQLTQMIMWPGKLSLMRAAVQSQADAAGASLDGKKLDLAVEARRAYFMLVMNSKRRELNRAARGLAATIASAALGRYASQAGGHHEVVRAELDVQALDVEYQALDGEQQSMIAMLNALRFQPPDATFAVPAAVSWTPARTYQTEPLVAAAAKNRPELHEMAAMKDGMIKMASLARKEPYPDLMVGGWYNQMLVPAPSSFGFMVGGTIPFWGVERSSLKAQAFDNRADAVSREVASMSTMIRAQVVDAMIRFDTGGRQVALLEATALPKARENFDTSLSAYSTGGVDIIGVLDSRRSLQAIELMLIEARVQREIALAVLERAVGGPLPSPAP